MGDLELYVDSDPGAVFEWLGKGDGKKKGSNEDRKKLSPFLYRQGSNPHQPNVVPVARRSAGRVQKGRELL